MKTINHFLKTLAFSLAFLILLQGCTVYKSSNVTLNEASKSKTVVKVKTNNSSTQKFKRIEFENGHYYGIKFRYGKMIKTEIDKSKVEKVQLKDKTLSTVLPIAISVTFILLGLSGNLDFLNRKSYNTSH